ncbi:MAG: extracellular solute-binding protein [Ferrovibrio sp.]|uniref:extracellular solute-binding protein n=1 Tax=Ferrovibrio sp. TaxID=1917215 RepID=UPI0026285F1D|nr:extracellular solute-binding protein [Ferrovibrio sp.]MCW0234969.1 extracellular solute-binding protein [Ferrovibrio sp.]
MTITRRTMLTTGAAAMAAYTAGLPGVRAQSSQVVVGTWGGDYGQLLGDLIDKPIMKTKGGIEVLQDIANADPRKTKLLAEKQSRRGTMDVACLSDSDMYLTAQQDLFEPVTADKVSRMNAVFPNLQKAYAIPHIYSAQVVLYNPNKVNPAPKGFADLWDPKWRGRVGFSDILYSANTVAAALAGGGSLSNYGPSQKKLMELRSLDAKIYPSNEALAAALKSEEVWITVMWLARGFMWKKAGIPLEHVVPSEGAPAIVFEASIPKNSRNKDNAFKYLNAMLEPQAQIAFADKMGYVPTVKDAALPPDLAKQINLNEAERARLLQPDYDYAVKNNAAILDFWNKQFKA